MLLSAHDADARWQRQLSVAEKLKHADQVWNRRRIAYISELEADIVDVPVLRFI